MAYVYDIAAATFRDMVSKRDNSYHSPCELCNHYGVHGL